MVVSHIDIEFSEDLWNHDIVEVGIWLDENMPNPPNDESPRWFIGNGQEYRWGIRFYDEEDAALFILRWGFK